MDLHGRRNHSTCDVLVVGAGPAGCTGAGLLSRQGLSVMVVEKDDGERGKVCGDLLGPRTIRLLQGMDLFDRLIGEGGYFIPKIRIFDEKGLRGFGGISPRGDIPGYGISLERTRFDAYMRKEAEESGAQVLRGIRIEKIERPGNGWICCQGISQRGEVRFRSRMVLGADGVHSRIARQTGLFRRIPGKMILAVRSYFRNVPDLHDAMELYFLPGLLPGYGWVIPLDTTRANIGIGMRADVCLSRRINLRRHFTQFIQGHHTLSKRLKQAEQTDVVQGWPIGLYGQAWRNYGPHVLLMGDAGNFADPLSGEGIYGALESAQQAARTCTEAFEEQRFDETFLSRYEGRWRRCFQEDLHYADRLISLPTHRRGVASLVLWAIRRMSSRGVVDEAYASMITGFFCGVQPRKDALSLRFIAKTLFG